MVESLSSHAGPENGSEILPLHVTERNAIEQAIRACNGNVVRAAALLEISASTIYRKLAHWQEVPNGEAAALEMHA